MEIGVKEAAAILNVSEKTIYRWVSANQIPFYRVGSQYRFSTAKLNEWLLLRSSSSSAPLNTIGAREEFISLQQAVRNGGIYYRVGGSNVREVLSEILSFSPLPAGTDRDILLRVLLEREKLSSTGIGDGIAVPHTRDPVLLGLERPSITLGFLEQAVDFSSIDGRPVKAVFLILSSTARCHLHLISRLSYALRRDAFIKLIHEEMPREAIFSALSDVDGMTETKAE